MHKVACMYCSTMNVHIQWTPVATGVLTAVHARSRWQATYNTFCQGYVSCKCTARDSMQVYTNQPTYRTLSASRSRRGLLSVCIIRFASRVPQSGPISNLRLSRSSSIAVTAPHGEVRGAVSKINPEVARWPPIIVILPHAAESRTVRFLWIKRSRIEDRGEETCLLTLVSRLKTHELLLINVCPPFL